jgi:putative hemolysin
MFRKMFVNLFMLALLISLGACSPQPAASASNTNMANPASVFCEQNGGKLEIRTDASGAQTGFCVFPNGSVCDEWAYFRGECAPAKPTTAPTAVPTFAPQPTQAPLADTAADGCKLYRDAKLGYVFHLPAGAQVTWADDPPKTLTVMGPKVNDEFWPVIYVNHPQDRADYRPTEGADLLKWLTDHNLLIGARQADLKIAGSAAVHTRQDRSKQTYAFDTFFFAHAGQLYSVVILHAGDKEDWKVYNHFLENFQFAE